MRYDLYMLSSCPFNIAFINYLSVSVHILLKTSRFETSEALSVSMFQLHRRHFSADQQNGSVAALQRRAGLLRVPGNRATNATGRRQRSKRRRTGRR